MNKRFRLSVVMLSLLAAFLLSMIMVSCTSSTQDPADTGATDDMADTTDIREITTSDDTASPEANTTDENVTEADTVDTSDTAGEEIIQAPASVIDALSPAYGATVCVANASVAEYASNFTVGYSANYHGSGDIYAPLPLTLTWEDVGADCYRVRLATSADFSDSKVVLTAAETVSFSNPMVATTYYWQVEALYEDRTDASAVFMFQTAATPRTVYIDGVTNTRDIGGYAISETTRLRQGMIYRSALLNDITQEGLYQAREELGIRCELDLRTPGEGGAGQGSYLGENILYYNFDGVYYGGIMNTDNWETLANEIKVFADPNNYPMVVHCSLGRDRTGTAIMLVMALCGVSKDDIYCDYELSMFSEFCCGNTTETMVDGNFTPTLNYLRTVGRKKSLQENAEIFLLSIGVTADEIASIRSILVEEVK